MLPTRTFFSLLLLPVLAGCGGATIILKSPIESRCGAAGLKGCPELTDGVLLYVEGKEEQGKEMLLKGAAENAPKKVRKFAKAIKELDKIPGTQKYTATLMKVADILASAKGDAATAKKGRGGGADDDDGPAAPPGDDTGGGRSESGTVTPATSRDRAPCGGLAGFGTCALALVGPLVLTDMTMGAGCSAEMAVGVIKPSAALELPRWVARNPHGMGHQRVVVRSGESMFVGVQAAGANDARCSLTWTGFRPTEAL